MDELDFIKIFNTFNKDFISHLNATILSTSSSPTSSIIYSSSHSVNSNEDSTSSVANNSNATINDSTNESASKETPILVSHKTNLNESNTDSKVNELENVTKVITNDQTASDTPAAASIPIRSPYKSIYDKALAQPATTKITKTSLNTKVEIKKSIESDKNGDLQEETTKNKFTDFVQKEKPPSRSSNKQSKGRAVPLTIKETRLVKQSSHLARSSESTNCPQQLPIIESKSNEDPEIDEIIIIANKKPPPATSPMKTNSAATSVSTPSRTSSRAKKECYKLKYLQVLTAELGNSDDEEGDATEKLSKKAKKK